MSQALTHADVISAVNRWLLSNHCARMAFNELPGQKLKTAGLTGESPDIFAVHAAWSILIEAKVSRQDFLADSKKSFRKNPEEGVGNYRLYACPEGLISVDELPDGWGLLYVTPRKAVKLVHGKVKNAYKRSPFWFTPNQRMETSLLFTALSRVHYAGFIGVINSWKSSAYNHMLENGITEKNASLVADQMGSIPAPIPKLRKKRRTRVRKKKA